MPNSIFKIAFGESLDQLSCIDYIKSVDCKAVSLVLNVMDMSDDLAQAFQETDLPIELPLAYYNNIWGIDCPTFTFTKVIKFVNQLAKIRKQRRLNISRCSFSFSKYNANDLLELAGWNTLRRLRLDYYVAENTADKDNNLFFKNLATVISNSNSLIKLKLNAYSYKAADKPAQVDDGRNGLANYFPYHAYNKRRPVTYRITNLETTTIQQLLKAFIVNYSLLEIKIAKEQLSPLHQLVCDVDKWLKDAELLELFEKSLKDFGLQNTYQKKGLQDFIDMIIQRNQEAARRMREAAARGQKNKVENLLKMGVSVYGCDDLGNTALHYAAQNGCIECVKLLRSYHADWRVPNNNDKTPKQLAQDNKRVQIVNIIEDITVSPAKITPTPERFNITGKAKQVPAPVKPVNPKSVDTENVGCMPSLYPKLESVTVSTKKKFTSLMQSLGIFKEPRSVGAIGKQNNVIVQTDNNQVLPLYEPVNTMVSKTDRSTIASQIAEKAITGAINGLDNVQGNYSYQPLKGLYADAPFNAKERAKVSKLIVNVLKASQEKLEGLNDVQIACLIRSFAEQLQKGILRIKDSSNCEVEMEINKDFKDKDKIKLLENAISIALDEASNRIVEAAQPSAPPVEPRLYPDLSVYKAAQPFYTM